MSNLGFATKEHSREMKLRLLGQLSSLFRTGYAISMDEKKRQPVVYILGGGLMDPLLNLQKPILRSKRAVSFINYRSSLSMFLTNVLAYEFSESIVRHGSRPRVEGKA